MKLIKISDKNLLNNFLSTQVHSQFLQSWEWGSFLEEAGLGARRLGIEDGNKLVAVMTLVKKPLPLNKSYFYCPRGPLISLEIRSKKFEVMGAIFDYISQVAIKENVLFLRFEPFYDIISLKKQIFRTIDVQPSKTTMLDLRSSKSEILKNMRQKTRYNIRLAQKRGVKIIKTGQKIEEKDFNEFWDLMKTTVERDQFRPHGKDYYYKMLNQNNSVKPQDKLSGIEKNQIKKKIINSEKTVLPESSLSLKIRLYKAEYEGAVVAANIVAFLGDTATYVHGASANKHRNVMAPYLLQWQAIKDARDRGCHYYDFNGIDEVKWPGVTRFKMGYGGQVFEYPGTYDMVFSKTWYNIYKVVRKIRRAV